MTATSVLRLNHSLVRLAPSPLIANSSCTVIISLNSFGLGQLPVSQVESITLAASAILFFKQASCRLCRCRRERERERVIKSNSRHYAVNSWPQSTSYIMECVLKEEECGPLLPYPPICVEMIALHYYYFSNRSAANNGNNLVIESLVTDSHNKHPPLR